MLVVLVSLVCDRFTSHANIQLYFERKIRIVVFGNIKARQNVTVKNEF